MANWIDDLIDDIEEALDTPQVKFNTHRNRKNILGEIKTLIANAVHENTTPKVVERMTTPHITRPNAGKQRGYAVMTEQMSEHGDEVHNGFKPNINPVKQNG